jgi:spermidine synthase
LVNQIASHLIGADPSALRHWSIAFALPSLAILPATIAMGATLPAMERIVSHLKPDRGCLGAIYAANTFGAVGGLILSAFIFAPQFGLRESVWCFALLNVICGAIVLVMSRASQQAPMQQKQNRSEPSVSSPARPSSLFSKQALNLFITGLLGIGYETVGVRVLSQVLENTVYTYAAVLSVFLLGTALGAVLYQRFLRRLNSQALFSNLAFGLSAAGLLGILALARAQPTYDLCRAAFGDSETGVLFAEMIVASTVFGPPTILMGALFSDLVQNGRFHFQSGSVGKAASLNTFGCALAPAVFSVALLPAIGSKATLVLISLSYLGLGLGLFPKPAAWRWGVWALPIGVLLSGVIPTNLRVVQIPPGGKLANYREGVMASVAVVEDAEGNKTLRVDNRFQMGGTAAAEAEYRHAHIPLLLHPSPRRALFLGLGTGITFGAASLHPNLDSEGVELLPEVVDVIPEFEPYNLGAGRKPGLKMHVADARRFIRASTNVYDVIVADLFHPARDGAGSLYTLEHFQAIRQRLAAGGLFCQWLPLYQLDEAMLRVIIQSFLSAFPEAQAYLLRMNVDVPVLGLIGSVDWAHYSAKWVEKRIANTPVEPELRKLALADSVRFFGNLLAGPKELRELAGGAPLNTDDHPVILFGAPRFTYQKNANAHGCLLSLLERRIDHPEELLRMGSDSEKDQFARRLKAYLGARDIYLKGLIEEAEGHSAQAIDAFVESARLSEDFTSGYAQCLSIASLEAKSNPAKARAVLERLVQAQPSRPIAAEMLRRLNGLKN